MTLNALPALEAGNVLPVNALNSFANGQQQQQTAEANHMAIAKQKIEAVGAVALGAMGGKLDGQVDPAIYEQGLDHLASQGFDVSGFRGKPEFAPVAARASLTALQQLGQSMDQARFDQTLTEFSNTLKQQAVGNSQADQRIALDTQKVADAKTADANTAADAAATKQKIYDIIKSKNPDLAEAFNSGAIDGPSAYKQLQAQMAGPPAANFDDTSGVRKEIQQLPSYKNYAQALPIYNSMTETAGRDSKASDLNLVYGLGKIMDPNSVVREGEMVMVKDTASLPDWLQGAISSLNGGAALTPETRAAIMKEAYGRVKGYSDSFGQDTQMYQGIAGRNGINPADIIPNYAEPKEYVPTTGGGSLDDLLKKYP